MVLENDDVVENSIYVTSGSIESLCYELHGLSNATFEVSYIIVYKNILIASRF